VDTNKSEGRTNTMLVVFCKAKNPTEQSEGGKEEEKTKI
tara:strand:- start:36 stop:152 length:117 start_codon:yes stop_codon:yes gene_type:complete